MQNTGRRPTPPDAGDGGYSMTEPTDKNKEQRELMIKRMKQDEEDFIIILSQWVVNNN